MGWVINLIVTRVTTRKKKHTAVESLLGLTKPINFYWGKEQWIKIFSSLEIAHVVGPALKMRTLHGSTVTPA